MSLASDLAIALEPVLSRQTLGPMASEPRLSPASLALVASPHFRVPPHIELLDRAIVETVSIGGRLLVAMPPRHGKSELCSRFTPAWYLGTHPESRVILASYEGDFAASWGRKARDVLEEHGEALYGIRVRQDSSAAYRWDLEGHAGGMTTAGAGGAITGRGADLLLVDDPVKSVEEAESKTHRDRVWDWWRGVALTRLEPGAAVIVIMTRWHDDDLAGRILRADGAADWRLLCLPALAEEGEDDPIGRATGDPLWPERYDAEALARRRREMGSRLFAAEYQQRPSPAEGSIFKRCWFRYWSALDVDKVDLGNGRVVKLGECRRLATCDLAVSTSTSADYTVIATWAVTPAKELILLDLFRARMEGPDIIPALQRAHQRFRPSVIGIEATAYQLTIVQEARRAGLPVRALRADRDKVSRALTAAAYAEGGRLFFESGATYLDDLEAELLSFPAGRHDDMVDAVSYATADVSRFAEGPRLRVLSM
jgi:predicted phage terminase large subunit-like protein